MTGGRRPDPCPTRPQIFQVSTLYGAATLAAALDAGLFGPREEARRVLLVSNNAAIPETALRLDEMHGYERISAGSIRWSAGTRRSVRTTPAPGARGATT
ncbi:hypothetical protein STENM327S_08725 [Streptomyces tendae]